MIRPTFAAACLLDSYEVVADLIGVTSGIAGPAAVAEMLWPGALHLPAEMAVPMMAHQLSEVADELVVLPADLPDLPGLVLAKLFKVLHRTDIAIAPEQAGERLRGDRCLAATGRLDSLMTRWTLIAIRLSG